MSIGETLAQARRAAGLTLADMSHRTRIREAIIRGIEQDDYRECGGDFYARGHIRSLARAAGIDPEPLIGEYDRVWREPDAITDVLELVTASRAAPPDEEEAPGPPPGGHPVPPRRPGGPPRPPGPRWQLTPPWLLAAGAVLVLALGAIGFGLLSGSAPRGRIASGAATRPATGQPAVQGSGAPARHPGRPAASATPSAPASPAVGPARALRPAGVSAFGSGGAGDNANLAHLAIDGNPATAWHTDWYTSAALGNLYPGTGLLLDMGHPVTVTAARISLGPAPGATFQLRVGDQPSLGSLPVAARATGAGGVVNLHLSQPAHGRYVLIWFTRLPPDSAGTFQAIVREVTVTGQS